jgi:hypothetical protein
MTDSPPRSSHGDPPPLPLETVNLLGLARAVRFAFVALVVVLSYFNIRLSFGIPNFMAIVMDMLNGKPLPPLTMMVIKLSGLFMAVSVLIPVAALATFLMQGVVRSIYILGVLQFIAVVQIIVLYQALMGPLFRIISTMSEMASG